MNYSVPRGVGVTQVAYEMLRKPVTRHFTTKELLDDISSHGIRIVKLWLEGNPFDGAGRWGWTTPWGVEMPGMGSHEAIYEDMDEVWRHPGVDVYRVDRGHVCRRTDLRNRKKVTQAIREREQDNLFQ